MIYLELPFYHQGNRYIHHFLECLQGLYKCWEGHSFSGSSRDISEGDSCMRAITYCTSFQENVFNRIKKKKKGKKLYSNWNCKGNAGREKWITQFRTWAGQLWLIGLPGETCIGKVNQGWGQDLGVSHFGSPKYPTWISGTSCSTDLGYEGGGNDTTN